MDPTLGLGYGIAGDSMDSTAMDVVVVVGVVTNTAEAAVVYPTNATIARRKTPLSRGSLDTATKTTIITVNNSAWCFNQPYC